MGGGFQQFVLMKFMSFEMCAVVQNLFKMLMKIVSFLSHNLF
jgi:hypothetical protein